ncbi:MAG: methyl-accepting chemotaxis protein [Motiliproteus sp.]
MRITSLTRLSAGALLLAIAGVAASVFWGLNQLQTPFRLNQDYFLVIEKVSVRTRKMIDNYLNTGNAVDLQAAQTFMSSDIRTSLDSLPASLRSPILPALEALQAGLETDLRAAGKLAGNSQGLLLQNERETLDALESLTEYAIAAPVGRDDAVRHYRALVGQAGLLVSRRAIVRTSYFQSPSQAMRNTLISQSEALHVLATQMQALPELGVWQEQEADEFAAMIGNSNTATERTEIGEGMKSSLVYLSSRYAAEVDRTSGNIHDGQAASERVNALMADLEQRLDEGRTYLAQITADIEHQVMILVSLFLLLLLSIGVGTSLVQLSSVRVIGRIGDYLKQLGAGDFSQQMTEASRYTELNQLRQSANQLQTYMSQLVSEIRHEVLAVDSSSCNINQVAESIHDSILLQSQRTAEADKAIGQLAESFRLVADHALEASDAADVGLQSVSESAQRMAQLESTISDLSEEVRQGGKAVSQLREDSLSIETMLDVIVSIAEQTNLLALNAAIEAARAGEHGRGFAVVADEVRQLSQRTASSTLEIQHIIKELRNSTDHVMGVMDSQQSQAQRSVVSTQQAAEHLNQVVTAIDKIHGLNTLIAQATEEQASSASSVKENVADVQRHSLESADQTGKARRQSNDLAQISRKLNVLVERFTV